MAREPKKLKTEKKVTRYTYDEIKEPRTPETGHTSLLPAEELVVTLPMDNGWSKAIEVGKLPEGDERPVVVDMDPAADPVLFWAGKRSRREVPVLPLQRNEIVSESRIAQIIERARRAAEEKSGAARQGHLFADLEKTLRESDRAKRVEFYTHEEGWKNKVICGDSLHAMESLVHYENLRGKVQMIYIDPPYGIRYDSNFQQRVDSTANESGDPADDVLTIKAFRDTWSLGPHSYLSYLQERLYLCRELLTGTGSIFFQIGGDNVHLVRALLDEVFGKVSCVTQIVVRKTTGATSEHLAPVCDFILWYARDIERVKYRQLYLAKDPGGEGAAHYSYVELPNGDRRPLTVQERDELSLLPKGSRLFTPDNLQSASVGREKGEGAACWFPVKIDGREYLPNPKNRWKTNEEGMARLVEARRVFAQQTTVRYVRYLDDFRAYPLTNVWTDVGGASDRIYVVQTNSKIIGRCILMATDPGELVFDPTCGSGTTAFAAETYGRRWITCDASRVATNIARQRLLTAIYPHFKTQNGAVSGGFIFENVSRTTLRSIAYGQEPETVALIDRPVVDAGALRVTGPFEVMSLGRYSVEDWKGYVVRESGIGEAAKLSNYIEVICRLYRKDAAIQGATGLVHALAETEKEKIAISVGPLSGRVTGKQINDAVQDALASGILEVHVLGWAFEANVGEVKSQLEKRGRVKVELIMIRPDTLAEGLKATQPEMLFSPLALPDIAVAVEKNGKAERTVHVTLKGVALFDRKRRTTEYKTADSGYVSAWYLDEDYDGDCFVDCQMFFDFKKMPNIKAALRTEVDPEEFTLKLAAAPFAVRGYKRIAVKVVDVYGNESTVVKDLG
jgi:adenine-specific DNA-methyltransferase